MFTSHAAEFSHLLADSVTVYRISPIVVCDCRPERAVTPFDAIQITSEKNGEKSSIVCDSVRSHPQHDAIDDHCDRAVDLPSPHPCDARLRTEHGGVPDHGWSDGDDQIRTATRCVPHPHLKILSSKHAALLYFTMSILFFNHNGMKQPIHDVCNTRGSHPYLSDILATRRPVIRTKKITRNCQHSSLLIHDKHSISVVKFHHLKN